jgi:hypothetical protein
VRFRVFLLSAALLACGQMHTAAPRPNVTAGAWTAEQAKAIVDKTQPIRLAPDVSALTEGERAAVAKLLEVGAIFQELYEDQRHRQAPDARADLASPGAREDLRTLYRLFQGPIANTLDNERVPFLAVDPIAPGKTVYPWQITKDEIEAYLAAHPGERDELIAPRTVVRRGTELADALATLARHPVLDALHPGLQARLSGAPDDALVAVPYSVAYGDRLVRSQQLLFEAADLVEADDAQLAGYLRNRGRDLLSDDYESGDAAWVSADFKHLNVQVGSYETYDDELYGTKTFFCFSLLAARTAEGEALRGALQGLQALEDALPSPHHRKVRERIPVGVYDVIADFGQARGGNTATILPNEPYLARRYGRTILLRANIMRNPDIFGEVEDSFWESAIVPAQVADLTPDGNFYRTLWHEIGHYLGIDATKDGRDVDVALEDAADLVEEMKADLVSLFVVEPLRKQGYYDDAAARALHASGVLRVLQNNKPRRDQPYNTMQLMQWNYFLAHGLLSFDQSTGLMTIDHAKYHEVVASMLREVLTLQYEGDKAAAEAFIAKYTTWDDALHGAIAARIREHQRYRYRNFSYAALGED